MFDCSFSYRNQCLNSQLLPGPILGPSFLGVLLRFRQHRTAVETLNQCFTRCACYLRINLSCDSSGVTWTAKRLQRCMNGKFSPLARPQALAVLFTSSKGSSRTHKQMSTLPIPYTTASTWITVYKVYLPQRKPKTFFTVCALPSPLGALKSDNGPVMILRSSVTYLLKPGQNKQSSGYHTILLLIPQNLH